MEDERVLRALPRKLAAREVEFEVGDLGRRLTGRKAGFEADWKRNLLALLPRAAEVESEDAWEVSVEYAWRTADGLSRGRDGGR